MHRLRDTKGMMLNWQQLFGRAVAVSILSLCCLSLVACGFHLRGAYQLPVQMQQTYVDASNQNSELVRSLKRSLKANDIETLDSKQNAQATLRIFNETNQKRVISVDAQGRAREYQLIYKVSVSLNTDDDAVKMDAQNLELSRDFLFDTEDVLGKGREEATLIKDMQQDMVRLIMLRIQALAR